MGTLTLPCTGGTFLSYVFPTADNSGMTHFPTCSEFLRTQSSTSENSKVYYSYRDRLDTHAAHLDFGGSIIEFAIDSLLRYKRITNAVLHINYESNSYNTSATRDIYLNGASLSDRLNYWHEKIDLYDSNTPLSQINLNNYESVGYQYYGFYRDLHNVIPTGITTYNSEINLNAYFKSYVNYGKIRFIISSGQSIFQWGQNSFSGGSNFASSYFYSNYQSGDPGCERYINKANTYIVVEYEDIPPTAPTPLSPVNTGLNPNRDITFTWQYNASTPATQASATIQYRAVGGSWTTVTSPGAGTFWTLSGGLPTGNYEWRVATTDTIGQTSAYSAIASFSEVAQIAPTAVYPSDNITFMESSDIAFSWIYNSLTPARQASATVKYRIKGAGSWSSYQSNNGNPFCTIENLSQGNYEWKVSIVNEYGEASPDSGTLEFNIIGRPQPPIINTPANCCVTTISWNASGQESAEVMLYEGDNLLIHETIATAVTEYKPQMFLKGTYKVKARIKNNSDLWSDFRELTFTIDAAGPTAGTLSVIPLEDKIELKGQHSSSNAALIRIEDGVETIISRTANAIDDKVASNTDYIYILRSWDNGGYTDSVSKIASCSFKGSIISSEYEQLILDKSETPFLNHQESIKRDYIAQRFVGREYPVIERDEFTNVEISKTFHVTKEQKTILDRMSKLPSVYYRDSRGNSFKAVIISVQYTGYMSHEYIAEITIIRTEPDEVIINV